MFKTLFNHKRGQALKNSPVGYFSEGARLPRGLGKGLELESQIQDYSHPEKRCV